MEELQLTTCAITSTSYSDFAFLLSPASMLDSRKKDNPCMSFVFKLLINERWAARRRDRTRYGSLKQKVKIELDQKHFLPAGEDEPLKVCEIL